MEKKSLGRGLEDIADIYISQKSETNAHSGSSPEGVKDVVGGYYPWHPLDGASGSMSIPETDASAKNSPDICVTTEHVTSKKEIGYVNTPEVQQNIIKSLSQYLRRNYSIKHIELVKESQVSQPGHTKVIEENISIHIQPDSEKSSPSKAS